MGFERLGALTHIPARSLMRMLGPRGNPQAKNLFDVIGQLQRAQGVRANVSLRSTTRGVSRLTAEARGRACPPKIGLWTACR